MRIGIDGGCLTNRRGFGRFARQTLQALGEAESPHEFVVLVDRPSLAAVTLPARFERVVVEVAEAPSAAASSLGRRSLRDMLAMGRAAAGATLDLMYFPASYSFFPVWNVGRVVVTIHDTMAFAHPELIFPTWQGRIAWTIKENAAARWADRIVTVSESARRDLIAHFRLDPDGVRVVTEGPDAIFGPRPEGPESDQALRRYGSDPSRKFLLYVGGLNPHKNLPRLVEAFARSGLANQGVRLVLVGDLGDVFHTHVPEIRALVSRHGLDESVVFTGFVPDDDLVYFNNRAVALVQPSLTEGFGLPPVEAMACGTPVISSDAGSLPEVVGDAGVYFAPTDVVAMAGALRNLFDRPDERARLAALAIERAKLFRWSTSARSLLATFEELGPARDDARRRSA